MGCKKVVEIDIDEALKFELAPVPTSMFEDSGDMRDSGEKSALKRTMVVKTPHRLLETSSTNIKSLVIDGCAIFYSIHWPNSSSKVADYIVNFRKYLSDRLDKDIYLIFNRYCEYSTKVHSKTSFQNSPINS